MKAGTEKQNKEKQMERMKELVQVLSHASKTYYQDDAECMSNYEYDALYDELTALEKDLSVTMSGSPTDKVGYTVLSALDKVTHDTRMLSLDKTKDIAKLEAFLGEQEGLLSWKLDGLTIVLKYNNGLLTRAVTRGNGEEGEDVTHNAVFFKNIPRKIPYKDQLTVRGEAVISYTDFTEINEALADEIKFKNPRNLCSGTVKQLNNEIAAKRNVSFVAFSLVEGETFTLKSEELSWLVGQGFAVAAYEKVTGDTLAETVRRFERLIPENGYPSDGLVLTFNSIAYSAGLGVTSKFPKDSVAFKWADETGETVLREIEWNVSRTGLINPVAIFDPVSLEGSTVTRASLHNVSVLESLTLGIGDHITVYKANMIIPQIAENLTRSGHAGIPNYCPACGGVTEIVKLRDGKALKCANPHCVEKLVQFLAHFVSRDAMNIEGLSEATIGKFVECGYLKNYVDLFQLARYKQPIIEMEGFGEKSCQNLMTAIEQAKNPELANFIYALGIQNVGLSNSRLLCRHFNSDLDAIIQAKADELLTIEGFGEVIVASVAQYFANESNRTLLKQARRFIRLKRSETSSAAQSLAGLVFVITGNLAHFQNRKELQAEIEKRGGKVTGSVTGKTSYLVNNDAFSASAKNKKAQELGVSIITEEQVLEILD